MNTQDALIAALGGLTPATGPIPVAAGTALTQPAGERLMPAMGAGAGSVLGSVGGGLAGGLAGGGLGALGMGLYEKYRGMPWWEELLIGRDPSAAAAYGADIGAPLGALAGAMGGGALGAHGGADLAREGIKKTQEQQRAIGQRDLMLEMMRRQQEAQAAAAPPMAPEEKMGSAQGNTMDYEKLAAGIGAIARLNQQGIDHAEFYKVASQSGNEVLVALADAINSVYLVSNHEKTAGAGQASIIARLEQIIFG